MRLLLSTRSAYGHLYPMMPLADAARAAGHDVVFSVGPEFVPKLEALGYRAHPTGIEIREAGAQVMQAGIPFMGPDGRTNLDFGAHVFVEVLARRVFDDLLPVLADEQPDVVVYGQFDPGAGVAAGVAGVPAVCHAISPHWPAEPGWSTFSTRLAKLCGDHGVAPSLDGFVGDTYLAIFPTMIEVPSFAAHPARRPMRPVSWSEPGATSPTSAAERRRHLIYVTLGTMVASDASLRPIIDGVATLDADVLVALGSAAGTDMGPQPPNVRLEPFVDQASLIDLVDLVVHHGGSGTVLAALGAGVPQVVIPTGADQFVNADRLAAAGLASVLPPAEATPEAVATTAQAALLGAHRREERAAQIEIQGMPHPTTIVDELAERFG